MWSTLLWIGMPVLLLEGASGLAVVRDIAIEDQLPGTYEHVNIAQMLNIDSSNSHFLNLLCPQALRVDKGDTAGSFKIQIRDASRDENKCYIAHDALVEVTLNRGELQPDSRNETSGTATLAEVYDHFPVFYGLFSDHSLLCPAVELAQNVTNVIAHDVAYIYTILNHYNVSGLPLGESFTSIARSTFEGIRGTYTVTISLHPDLGEDMTCDYLLNKDLTEMLFRVAELLAPEPTPSETTDPMPSNDPSNTPSPSPTSSPMALDDESRACFPANALVHIESGGFIRMQDLQVGDSILDGAGTFSTVILFSHSDKDAVSNFLHIHTDDGASIILSPTHYIFANEKMIPANEVKLGDIVRTIARVNTTVAETARVTRIECVTTQGLYNPQTTSGTIAIFWRSNAVLASTYTKAIQPDIAHSLLAPLRSLEKLMGIRLSILSHFLKNGIEFWPSALKHMQGMLATNGAVFSGA